MEKGKKFSLLYLDRSKTLRDSKRFRNRLAAYYQENLQDSKEGSIMSAIQLEIGAEVPVAVGISYYSVTKFFKESELRDLLDSITVIYKLLKKSSFYYVPEGWKNFVVRAMSEENLGYRLDDEGGVHFFV
ncbi:MAG: hypothetical protein MUO85_06035, partial [candidate division Zixibacteria bacterium]|nr:hypothetical protein [candidate division Zixibacteria bacterium]